MKRAFFFMVLLSVLATGCAQMKDREPASADPKKAESEEWSDEIRRGHNRGFFF